MKTNRNQLLFKNNIWFAFKYTESVQIHKHIHSIEKEIVIEVQGRSLIEIF